MTLSETLATPSGAGRSDHLSLAQAIRAQALSRPLDLAITDGSGSVTFGELLGWADLIAALVSNLPDEGPIAVLLPNGAAFAVSVLAMLQARRTYVPIDTGFPEHRVRRILDHAGAQAVVCDASTASLAEAAAPAVSRILVPARPKGPGPEAGAEALAAPNRIAAITYTSGSTGEPKGVARTEQTLSTRAGIFAADGGLSPEDRVPVLQPIAVGPSIQRLLGALSAGAQVCIIDFKHIGVTRALQALADFRPTVMFVVPSVFRALFRPDEAAGPAITGQMRWIRLSGDRIQHADVDLYRRRFPTTSRLWITIGSNETHTYASWHIDHETVLERPLVPVGYPRQDIDLSILAEDGRPVAPGELGEIVIANDRLAQGYWNDAALTDTRFVEAASGPIHYHTGDFGRLLPDGLLEFVGRRDSQVKVRGNTIHLAEVEAALDSCAGVDEAAVIVRTEAGETKLIAYCAGSAGLDLAAMRETTRLRLPAPMQPAHIVVMDALPRLATGKVDMDALERLDRERPQAATPSNTQPEPEARPASPMKDAVRACWNDILGAGVFETGDTFEDASGNSLAAMEILLLLERRLGRRLPFEMMDPQMRPVTLVERLEALDAVPADSLADDDTPLLLLFPQFFGAGFDLREFQQLLATRFRVLVCDYVDADDGMLGSIDVERYFVGIADRVASAGPPKRLWLLGYAFGCHVAAEAARRLAARGVAIEFVGLIAGKTPRIEAARRQRRQTPLAPRQVRRAFYGSEFEFFVSRIANSAALRLQRLGATSVLRVGIALLVKAGFRSAAGNTLVVSRRRAAEQAFAHLPSGPINMPVTVFATTGSKSESEFHPDLGWSEFCDQLTITPIVGGRKRVLTSVGGAEMLALLADIALNLRDSSNHASDQVA